MRPSEIHKAVTLFEVSPGKKFSIASLQEILPDLELAMFFAKLYKMTPQQLSYLLQQLFNSDLVQALTVDTGEHSHELQDYIVELGYEYLIEQGAITFNPAPPKGEVLPELWKSFEVDIAKAIEEVAAKVKDLVGAMPGKEGEMVFRSLMTVNAKRPIIGDYKAHIKHKPQLPNLLILDVSGSMTEPTIRKIVDDVVAMAYMANMWIAIVSNQTVYWEPKTVGVDEILQAAEFSGTHYETLQSLLDDNWGVVVTIADYDSSPAAEHAIRNARGSIEQVLDISLVNRPTYLSQVVGQLAKDVKPLLIAADDLTGSRW